MKFSKTITQSAITFSGTILNSILGLLFYIVLARNLGPDAFGIFSLTTALLIAIADIANVGIDTGLIKFIPKSVASSDKDYLKILKLGLEIKILIWLAILFAGWFLVSYISEGIFLKPQLTYPLKLALIGVGGMMLFSYVLHAIQAFQKYLNWSILNVSMNGLRLVLIFVLLGLNAFSLYNSLTIFVVTPFVGFLIGLLVLPRFFTTSGEWSLKERFFRYNKWIALITLTSAISSRLDTFLTARFLSTTELGVYSAATQLTTVMPQLTFALASVAAPKLASFDSSKAAFDYLKKLQMLTLGLGILGIALLPVVIMLIPLIFGSSYQGSIEPFLILFFAQLLFFIAIPSQQAIFYFFGKPFFLSIVNLINLPLMFGLGLILIPAFGVNGAASVIFVGNLFSLAVSLVWVIFQFKVKK